MQFLHLGRDLLAANDKFTDVNRAVGFDGERQLLERFRDRITFRHRKGDGNRVHHRRNDDHEDDEQHKADIDERCYVDVGLQT